MDEIEDNLNVQHIDSDHQLSPPRPWYREHWILWSNCARKWNPLVRAT
jgi:hypothetical protein